MNGFEASFLRQELKENFDRFKIALYKEKEMPEFRKWILALAVLSLFAGIAGAQVGPGNSSNTGTFTCSTNTAVTPNLRAEGYTEVVGDILLVCTGGIPPATNTTTPVPTANFVVYLNTPITSRLLATSGGASEALLMIDEPGASATETGEGPTLAQVLCNSATFGAGVGGCTEYLGTAAVPGSTIGGEPVSVVPSASTCTASSPCAQGANVFQGIVSGNQVTFFGIPVIAPSTSGNRVYRITNIRANANGIVAGGPTPGQVTASISISSSTSINLTNSTLTVGYVQQGLSTANTALRNYGNTGFLGSSGGAFAQCSNASVTSTGTTAAAGLIQFSENFGTAFKIRQQTNPQNVPGTIYNSESNFVTGTGFLSAGTNTTYLPGQADYATRLKAVFTNVPSGVAIWVTVHDVTNSVTTNISAVPNAEMVVSSTATDATSDIGPQTGAGSQPGVPVASQTAVYTGPNGATVGIAPLAVNSAGTAQATWEIVNTNPATIDTVDFGYFISYTGSPATNSPPASTVSVTLSFAPTPEDGAFTSSTGPVASNSLTIPRFSDSLDIGKSVAGFTLCTTALLYPYVINTNGFDTGLAIANTTTDPFGTSPQAGTCALYFYGSSAPTTNPFISPSIASGTVYANLASTLAAGFSGYMIANCNFQDAHGFAFVSDVGARLLAMGYLPLILTRSGTSPEALNN
jgi:hypothetical protein